jgi:hypothetical protein
VPLPLAPKSGRCPAAKLLLYYQKQLVAGAKIASTPGLEQSCYVVIEIVQIVLRCLAS